MCVCVCVCVCASHKIHTDYTTWQNMYIHVHTCIGIQHLYLGKPAATTSRHGPYCDSERERERVNTWKACTFQEESQATLFHTRIQEVAETLAGTIPCLEKDKSLYSTRTCKDTHI